MLYYAMQYNTTTKLYYYAILCQAILYTIICSSLDFYPNAPYNTWVHYTVLAWVGPVGK